MSRRHRHMAITITITTTIRVIFNLDFEFTLNQTDMQEWVVRGDGMESRT
jgi:hypothetical protein